MPIDMSAAKAPPRKRATTSARSSPSINTQSLNERRRDGLLGIAQLVQGVLLATRQYADAATIGIHFPPVATELANIANTSDVIAKPIDFLIEIGPYGALVSASMPLVLQLLANHGVIDASKAIGQSVVPPEVLEAQMKADIARMQAQALIEQRQAIEDAKKAQAEYEAMMTEGS